MTSTGEAIDCSLRSSPASRACGAGVGELCSAIPSLGASRRDRLERRFEFGKVFNRRMSPGTPCGNLAEARNRRPYSCPVPRPERHHGGGHLGVQPDGSICVEPAFRAAQASWYEGLATITRAGTGVIADEVFLDGGDSQASLQKALRGLDVLWVAVRCDSEIAEGRELQRGDRARGLARYQAERVHSGVSYDLVVDTSRTPAEVCAMSILATLEP
jgi:chloramphenicol 3-O phosphotransferase